MKSASLCVRERRLPVVREDRLEGGIDLLLIRPAVPLEHRFGGENPLLHDRCFAQGKFGIRKKQIVEREQHLQPQILRISSLESSGAREALRLDGHLGGPCVDELRRCCGQVLLEGRQLTLDLAGVSFVDRDGVRLLRSLKRTDVELRNCSPFVALRLQEGSVE